MKPPAAITTLLNRASDLVVCKAVLEQYHSLASTRGTFAREFQLIFEIGMPVPDTHNAIVNAEPVPGKAIVYKGASPVKEDPFTFEKCVHHILSPPP